MRIPGPVLAVGIVGSMVAIVVPSIACLRLETSSEWSIMGTIRLMLPAWLVLLVRLSMFAGRDMERGREERAER